MKDQQQGRADPAGRLRKARKSGGARQRRRGNGGPVELTDFVSYMPQHSYIFRPTGEMWPAGSVNARIGPVANGDDSIAANVWLDRHQPVEQMTWMPGMPVEIKDRLVSAGGWIERPGATVFNLYRPPSLRARPGDG